MRLQLTVDPTKPVALSYADNARAFAEGDEPEVVEADPVPIDGEAEDAPDGPDAETAGLKRWAIAVEGVPTGDGRIFEQGSLTWRELPLPLMALDKTTDAHLEARLVGHFRVMRREGDEIAAYSDFIASDDADVMRLQKLIANNDLPGVSVDLDQVEGTIEYTIPADMPEPELDPEAGDTIVIPFAYDEEMLRVSGARIMGATAVPFPALMEAKADDPVGVPDESLSASLMAGAMTLLHHPSGIVAAGFDSLETSVVVVLLPADPESLALDGGLVAADLHVTLGYFGDVADVPEDVLAALQAFVTDTAVGAEARVGGVARLGNDDPQAVAYLVEDEQFEQLRAALMDVATPNLDHPHFMPHMTVGYGIPMPETTPETISFDRLALWAGEERTEADALVASIEPPAEPPAEWFARPQLSGPTEITVTDEGRIFGHLAQWNSCHIGMTNDCVMAPRSRSNYAGFHTGEVRCADGSRSRVGQITTGAGHAVMSANAQRAKEHYDHTGWASADVAAGEDKYGIWVAGALRPGQNPAQVREMMASAVSGDWRTINGVLELVGIASVNVPGFHKTPTVQARVASGHIEALVATAVTSCGRSMADSRVAERIAMSIERHPVQLMARRDALAASIGRDYAARRMELRTRVKGDN